MPAGTHLCTKAQITKVSIGLLLMANNSPMGGYNRELIAMAITHNLAAVTEISLNSIKCGDSPSQNLLRIANN